MINTVEEPNVELLLLTLQTIIDNPKHWNQQHWHCGSSHCFAGFVQALHMNIDFKQKWPSELEEFATDLYYDLVAPEIQDFITNNDLLTTSEYAQEALNLDVASTTLFNNSNTLEDLKAMVSYIIEHKTLIGFVYSVNGWPRTV